MTVTTHRPCGSSAAYTPYLMPDLTLLAAREAPPFAGLGLAIAGGHTDEQLASAVRAFTLPPMVDLGVRFPDLPRGGSLRILNHAFRHWAGGVPFPGTPKAYGSALRDLRDEMQLVPLLPIVDLPATDDYWIVLEHLWLLLRRLAVGDIDLGALLPLETWPYRQRTPIPYRRPKVRGDVTPRHVRAFAEDFPGLAKVLNAAIPWSDPAGAPSAPAATANAVARKHLGIRVDLRVGSLVSADRIDDAIERAGGIAGLGGKKSLIERMADRIDRSLATVNGRYFGRSVGDLDGAAWSCAVDALLSREVAELEE